MSTPSTAMALMPTMRRNLFSRTRSNVSPNIDSTSSEVAPPEVTSRAAGLRDGKLFSTSRDVLSSASVKSDAGVAMVCPAWASDGGPSVLGVEERLERDVWPVSIRCSLLRIRDKVLSPVPAALVRAARGLRRG